MGLLTDDLVDKAHGLNAKMRTESHTVAEDLKDRLAHNHMTDEVKIYGAFIRCAGQVSLRVHCGALQDPDLPPHESTTLALAWPRTC